MIWHSLVTSKWLWWTATFHWHFAKGVPPPFGVLWEKGVPPFQKEAGSASNQQFSGDDMLVFWGSIFGASEKTHYCKNQIPVGFTKKQQKTVLVDDHRYNLHGISGHVKSCMVFVTQGPMWFNSWPFYLDPWRSLKISKRSSFHHPKKVTKNCQDIDDWCISPGNLLSLLCELFHFDPGRRNWRLARIKVPIVFNVHPQFVFPLWFHIVSKG